MTATALPTDQTLFQRTLTRAIALPLVLTVALLAIFLWQLQNLLAAAQWVDHTDRVITQAHEVQEQLLAQQSEFRGYLLTGDPEFLAPYTSGRDALNSAFAELEALTADNTVQTARIAQLRERHAAWDAVVEELVVRRQQGPLAEPIDLSQGRSFANAMFAEARTFIAVEERLRAERSQAVRRTTRTVVLSSIGAVAVIGTIVAFFMRGQLRSLAARYEQALDERTRQARVLAEQTEALRASERRFRQVTEGIPQMVWITRPDGYHEYFNQRWYDYTGMQPGSTDGAVWNSLLHPDDKGRAMEAWLQALRTGGEYRIEYRFKQAATGQYRWFIGEALPLRDDAGRIVKWFGTCTDIEDQKQSEAALRERTASLARATAALEERNRELDQFAYITSHDLKAPLRGIANLSQWIEEDLGDHATDDIRHQMELLRGRVHRMEALIDGILQYSRVGRTKSAAEPVDTRALLDEIVDLLAPPPTMQVCVAPDMPTVMAERVPLTQVFHNLVGNAIKHHHRAEGRICIGAHDDGAAWRFSVADDGPGIAPRYHEKIFAIFQTLQPRDKVEGSGLGLALVKKIVEHQGGTIWVESDEGAGTAFFFTWPKEAVEGQ